MVTNAECDAPSMAVQDIMILFLIRAFFFLSHSSFYYLHVGAFVPASL